MRLATVRTGGAHIAVRIDGPEAVEIDATDVGALLGDPEWRTRAERADGARHDATALDFAPLVPRPDKIICVGMNYRSHIAEMGREPPEYPTLFAKYSSALVGAHDDIVIPRVSSAVDWEVELAVVIGAPVRHVPQDDALTAVAGYSVLNDVSMRDYQNRTLQWLQGKTFESSTPLGPVLVTPDELGDPNQLELICEVDAEEMQRGNTSDLVFDPAALISYISEILTLTPGDVIATGTPGGVGHARIPPRYLTDGSMVVTSIEAIGECRNRCRADPLLFGRSGNP
ncbi:MAG: fumarylacetoacetate hydrolase family protein [Actinobacteria bacterium]|nr:fumarylacetoacetate hydrolase family protein [Actinomycetota bacterium]